MMKCSKLQSFFWRLNFKNIQAQGCLSHGWPYGRFEVELAPGVKQAESHSLRDLARSMSKASLRSG